jgi:hypothetical protein
MWEYLTTTFSQFSESSGRSFTAVDGGCGNGWATRKIAKHPCCSSIVGVDAAALMVDRAIEIRDEWMGSEIGLSLGLKMTFQVGVYIYVCIYVYTYI